MWTVLQAMIKRLAIIAALALALTPARADFGGFGTFLVTPPPIFTGGACQSDTVGRTTYTFSLATGANDRSRVTPIVVIGTMDGATTYNVSSGTIETVNFVEAVDDAGTRASSSAIIYLASPILNAATIDISVTMSEAIDEMFVCAYAVENLLSTTPVSFNSDSSGAGVSCNVTLDPTPAGGIGVGIITGQGASGNNTWTVFTEDEDTAVTDGKYSNAESTHTTGASMAVTATNATFGCSTSVATWR